MAGRFELRAEIADGDGACFRLFERRSIFRRSSAAPVAFDHWEAALDSGDGNPGLAILLGLHNRADPNVEPLPDGGGLKLLDAAILGLTEIEAAALGVPAPPFVLDIRSRGALNKSSLDIEATWKQDGRPAACRRHGALLEEGGRLYRLPPELFSVIEAIDAFRSIDPNDIDARMAAYAAFRETLPADATDGLAVEAFVQSFRLYYATALSVSVTANRDLDIDPLLFGRSVSQRLQDDEEAQVDEVENVLPPHFSERFQSLFGRRGARGTYALESGCYVLVDPSIRPMLTEISRLQKSTVADRRRFLENPHAHFRATLGGADGAQTEDAVDPLDRMFVVTSQLSRRVVGLGIWRPPVIPFIKRNPNTWLPESFVLRIGDVSVDIAPDELEALKALIETAITQGEPSVDFNGVRIPATKGVVEKLDDLLAEAATAPPGDDDTQPPDTNEPETEFGGKIVFEIQDNLENVNFNLARSAPRASPIDTPFAPPPGLASTLRPHQEAGVAWLQRCWRRGYSGCLLADDMGLGKTLQVLAFLSWLRKEQTRGAPQGPILVVAPTSLLHNWEREHDLHLAGDGLGQAQRLYGRHLGPFRQRRGPDTATGEPGIDLTEMTDPRDAPYWALTTYETYRDYHLSFAPIRFQCVVFDEIQKAKNPASLTTVAAKTVNSEFSIGLSGTPVENTMADLWSIMDILLPGWLGDLKQFCDRFPDDDIDRLKELHRMLTEAQEDAPPPVLRRIKDDVAADLPTKTIHAYRADMPAPQQEAYDQVRNNAKSGTRGDMLRVLHGLRGTSLHPYGADRSLVEPPDTFIAMSARLRRAFDVLDDVHQAGERALIFLEDLKLQDWLAAELKRRYRLANRPAQINGSMPPAKRQQHVDTFQAGRGFDVMILSPKAGGVGLTLTAANHVIHLSRWWNPAVEDQCTDRVYRIGQDKPVNIHIPMAIHPNLGDRSFDSILDDLLTRKRTLAKSTLVPPEGGDADFDAFKDGVFGSGSSKKDQTSLEDLDGMDGLAFERWAASRAQSFGWRGAATAPSRDGGADGVFFGPNREPILIQCKHRDAAASAVGDDVVAELLKARARWALEDARLIALTNAARFSGKVVSDAKLHGVELVSRNRILNWPG